MDNCTGQGNKIMESDNDKSKRKKAKTSFDKKVDKLLYAKPDYIDAFDDDYLYDCVEVSTKDAGNYNIRVLKNCYLLCHSLWTTAL